MRRHVAFLRGINLGRRRLGMDDLRSAFEDLGLDNVATYIASGNVIFDHPGTRLAALESRIENHLETSIGFHSDTFVRSFADLQRILTLDPVASARTDGFNIHVIFLRQDAGPTLRRALSLLEGPDDRFQVSVREILWLRRGRLTDSPVTDRDLRRALAGAETTMRNLNTIEKIIAKFS